MASGASSTEAGEHRQNERNGSQVMCAVREQFSNTKRIE
jgi:hypothetical protein